MAARLPFGAGERLTYTVRVARVGTVGRGEMTVEGPVDVRGHQALVLRFDFDTKVGPIKVMDHTQSWLDPQRFASLRFRKEERHPLSTNEESVEVYPSEHRWVGADGHGGQTTSGAPLDELSFMYFLRTVPLADDSTYRFDRHFDSARNPTTVRVVGRETLRTPAGEFPTVVVEMRVKDARRYRGDGLIRIHFTDDACRLPVQIESRMPIVGSAVLTLESYTPAPGHAPGLTARR